MRYSLAEHGAGKGRRGTASFVRPSRVGVNRKRSYAERWMLNPSKGTVMNCDTAPLNQSVGAPLIATYLSLTLARAAVPISSGRASSTITTVTAAIRHYMRRTGLVVLASTRNAAGSKWQYLPAERLE